jgi:hypothetical protein
MRSTIRPTLTLAALILLAGTTDARAQDSARVVADGGVFVSGWTGRIDDNETKAGQKLENAKFAADGNGFRITTGPAVTYWNPANRAAGDYTVKATFTESNYMGLNNHPHPYGIVVAGNDLGTDQQSYLYCAAYGNGSFIVRGFGPAAFRVNGQRGEPNAAVNKAAGKGSPVTQEIAVSSKGDRIECAINGTVVGSYPKADVVGAGKLKSTNGVYGLRFGHNTDAVVTGLTVTRAVTKE